MRSDSVVAGVVGGASATVAADVDLRTWARRSLRNRRRARVLRRLNAVLIPVCCLVVWLVYRAL